MIKKGDLQRKVAEGEKVRITDVNGLSLIIKGTKKGHDVFIRAQNCAGRKTDRQGDTSGFA